MTGRPRALREVAVREPPAAAAAGEHERAGGAEGEGAHGEAVPDHSGSVADERDGTAVIGGAERSVYPSATAVPHPL